MFGAYYETRTFDSGSVYAPTTTNEIHVNVESRQFGETDADFANRIAESMQESLNAAMDSRIVEANRYGGISNPR